MTPLEEFVMAFLSVGISLYILCVLRDFLSVF